MQMVGASTSGARRDVMSALIIGDLRCDGASLPPAAAREAGWRSARKRIKSAAAFKRKEDVAPSAAVSKRKKCGLRASPARRRRRRVAEIRRYFHRQLALSAIVERRRPASSRQGRKRASRLGEAIDGNAASQPGGLDIMKCRKAVCICGHHGRSRICAEHGCRQTAPKIKALRLWRT